MSGIIEDALQLSPRRVCHSQHLLLADWLDEFVEDAIDCERLDETTAVRLNLVELREKDGYFQVSFASIL